MKSSRDIRQELTLKKILSNNGRCYLKIYPGFGKTTIAANFINYCKSKESNITSLIVVPSDSLKTQWLDRLSKANIKADVLVINGITIHNKELKYDICILDEADRYSQGAVFSKIFSLVRSRALIAMSGTWSPEQEVEVQKYLPLGDFISFNEGKKNGWVSNIIEYNLALSLSDSEQEKYNDINELCEKYFAYFGQNFNIAKQCWSFNGALKYVVDNKIQLQHPNGTYLPDKRIATEYACRANMWRNYLRQRSDFIHNSIDKVNAVAYILNNLPDRKAFTFGYKTDTCDKLSELISNTVPIHSNIKSTTTYSSFLEKYEIKTSKKELTRITGKTINELNIKRFVLDEIRALHSVKALDLGIDVKGTNCVIIYGRDSNSYKAAQRQARSTRLEEEGKLALLVNVYLKNTQDEKWHNKIQGRKRVTTFTNIEELVNDFKSKT